MHAFERPGEENTDTTLRLARSRGEALGLRTFLIATTSGKSALRAAEVLQGKDLIAVTHCTGFGGPDVQELPGPVRQELEGKGVRVLTATHAFGTLGRAVRRKFRTYELEEIVANALRRFGEGTKVAIEIALMAADAGLVRTDRDVISMGGTSSGTDTALVLRPVNTHDFFDLQVREIVCKPFRF